MDTSQVCYWWATTGIPKILIFVWKLSFYNICCWFPWNSRLASFLRKHLPHIQVWITIVCLPVILSSKNYVTWKHLLVQLATQSDKGSTSRQDRMSKCSKTGHWNHTPAFPFLTISFLLIMLFAYLPHCLCELSDGRPQVLFFLYSPQCSVTVTEWINILSSQIDCKDTENRNSVLFFESPVPTTGSW